MSTATQPRSGQTPSIASRNNRKLQQVMEATERCFIGQGYDAVTMDAIARAANVSKATLYAYFPSKEKLFAALVEHKCRQIEQDVTRATSGREPIEEVLKTMATNFVTAIGAAEGFALFRIMVAESSRFPELGRSFYEAGPKVVIDRVAEFLAEAHERDVLKIPDAHLAAIQFMGLVQGDFLIRAVLTPDLRPPEERDRMIDSGIALFLAGYGRKAR